MVWYSGMSATWNGIIMPTSTTQNSVVESFDITRASGYAAIDEMATMSTTLETVTTAELSSAWPRPACSQAATKLSKVGCGEGTSGDDVSFAGRRAMFTST